nr:hypothetical protein [Tanacetum cinerariifolium]
MNQITHTSEPLIHFNSICYDDADDYDYEESTIPLSDITSQIPPSIVITNSPPVLPIKDPEDSLIMGNEELNAIPKKDSDEFIKSSVEDLVSIPNFIKSNVDELVPILRHGSKFKGSDGLNKDQGYGLKSGGASPFSRRISPSL